ncbi:unnamed protein product [Nesidiocoris tenuis]|uniref:W2 domain-containing protein n=1 Tax=Nesidiocoris tenuis TaxID=355587 RepID=A0A6H5G8I3_9HEMI|nr:unnamed protein product [Nesidiocoris tenuis]
MSVTVITSDRCSSLGDAMRDLDAKAILRGDFILVTGNLIGNLDLLSALERHRDCRLKSDVVIGKESIIKEMAHVLSSVVGKRCTIGANCVISNSYIFDDVVIEVSFMATWQTTWLLWVLISNNYWWTEFDNFFHIDGEVDESTIDHCVIASGCKIGSGSSLSGCILGPKVEIDIRSSVEQSRLQHAPKSTVFYSEIVDSMLRGYEDKLPCDNLVLEINSSRYAYNVPLSEVNYNVVRAILTLEQNFTWESLADRLKYFKPLFVNYMRNKDAMLECLNAIENNNEFGNFFGLSCAWFVFGCQGPGLRNRSRMELPELVALVTVLSMPQHHCRAL